MDDLRPDAEATRPAPPTDEQARAQMLRMLAFVAERRGAVPVPPEALDDVRRRSASWPT